MRHTVASALHTLIRLNGRLPIRSAKLLSITALAQRQPVDRTPASAGLEYEDVEFPSEDGVRLEGWFLPAGARIAPTIVFVHGWPWNRLGNRAGMMPWPDRDVDLLVPARALHNAGFHVLLFDLRNHGNSESAPPMAAGVHEGRDFVGAVRYLRGRADVDAQAIGAIGISMGGNAVMYGIPRCQPIHAAIAVQPPSTSVFMGNLNRIEFGRFAPIANAVSSRILALAGVPAGPEDNPVAAARHLGETRMLYVQGSGDQWGTVADVEAMAANTPNLERVIVYPSEERYGGYMFLLNQTAEVVGFFQRTLRFAALEPAKTETVSHP